MQKFFNYKQNDIKYNNNNYILYYYLILYI